MEDLKGDLEQGCTTLPIVKGLGYALRFAQVIAGVVTATVAVCTFVFFVKQYYILGVYTAATILIPLLVWIWFAGRQQTSRHYKLCSRWLKFIMLSGVFSLIVYHFSN
jgi:4-hydroxybenzoate polyprenyltransferase